jgi:hypothetical protein
VTPVDTLGKVSENRRVNTTEHTPTECEAKKTKKNIAAPLDTLDKIADNRRVNTKRRLERKDFK